MSSQTDDITQHPEPDTKDARIAALEADNARLIEALTPFAKSGDLLVQAGDRGDFWAYRPAGGDEYGITGKHLLAARATLAKIKEATDGRVTD